MGLGVGWLAGWVRGGRGGGGCRRWRRRSYGGGGSGVRCICGLPRYAFQPQHHTDAGSSNLSAEAGSSSSGRQLRAAAAPELQQPLGLVLLGGNGAHHIL